MDSVATNNLSEKVTINDVEYTVIDISGISKAALLAAMHNAMIPKRCGAFVQALMGAVVLHEEDAQKIIDKRAKLLIDNKDEQYIFNDDGIDYLSVSSIRYSKDSEGKVSQEAFERVLYNFDYVSGRAIKANISGDYLVTFRSYPYDGTKLKEYATANPSLELDILGKKVPISMLARGETEYESDVYMNTPGLLAEIVQCLAEGREPPNNIPEVMDSERELLDKLGIKVKPACREL